MPHNFRRHIELGLPESACAFVSKSGSDSNDGLTPNTPKKTILAGSQIGRNHIIVGADVYQNEQLGSAGFDRSFYADGCVVLKGDVGLTLASPSGWLVAFSDFIIFRYTNLAFAQTNNQRPTYYNRCYIIGGSGEGRGYDQTVFTDCTVKNCTFTDVTQLSVGLIFLRTNFIASNIVTRFGCNYCYLDANSSLSFFDNATTTLQNGGAGVFNNNIRCPITVSGTTYNSLADAKASNPSLFAGCINAEPVFNRPEKDDYTLKITSPHLNTGIGPSHLRLSSAWLLETDANPGEDITVNNIRLRSVANPSYFITPISTSYLVANSQGGIEVKPNSLGNNEGVITWNPRRIAESPSEINYYNFTTGLNFNCDYATDASNPSPFNSNVPDYSNFSAGTAGRNPNRLTEQWRWSRGVAPDAGTSSDWVTGATFLDFELFRAPWYNTNPVRGNGDPTFNWSDAKELPTATFIQSRWKLRQDRTN